MDSAEVILKELVTNKQYALVVGYDRITGKKMVAVLTEHQVRLLCLAALNPQSNSLVQSWMALQTNPLDKNGDIDLDQDMLARNVETLMSSGKFVQARQMVLNAHVLAKYMVLIGQNGRKISYWDELKKEVGL